MQPRGFRNNNPLNIIRTPIKWGGELPDELATDSQFEQFDTIEHGLIAAFKNIHTHIKRDARSGIRCTIEREIHRWCPDATAPAYVDFVERHSGYQRDTLLNILDKPLICHVVWAMVCMENGQALPYSDIEHAYNSMFH